MSNLSIASQRSISHLTLCATLLGALATTSCADVPEADDLDGFDEQSEAPAVQTSALQAADLRDPNGSYFASVKANGTGCPAGTWETSISSDGKVFTTTFNKYIAEVSPNTTVAIKDCQLAVKLHSPQGLSFAVQEFFYSGYAFLEKGVTARQVVNYYFQGDQGRSSEARTDLTGPKDDTFTFSNKLASSNLVYSACGTERDLNIRTTLRVLNGSPGATGYVNLGAVDGNTKLAFRLTWRKCDAGGGSAAAPATKAPATTTKTPAKPAAQPAGGLDLGAIIDAILGSGGSKAPAKPATKPTTEIDLGDIFDGIFGGGQSGPVIIDVSRD